MQHEITRGLRWVGFGSDFVALKIDTLVPTLIAGATNAFVSSKDVMALYKCFITIIIIIIIIKSNQRPQMLLGSPNNVNYENFTNSLHV